MIAQCACQHCGQQIEFEADSLERSGSTSRRILGPMVVCPNCHKQTQLYLNLASSPARRPPPANYRLEKCADCGKEKSTYAFWCPSCGSMGKTLFWKIFEIVSIFWLISFVFWVVGLIIWKLGEFSGAW